jgi:CHAT domain-containing protein
LEDAEYTSLHTTTPLDTGRVRQCLDDDEALIEYYLVNGRVHAFAFSRHEVRLFANITTADVTAPLLQYLNFSFNQLTLSADHKPAYVRSAEMTARQFLTKLYGGLIEPLESFLEDKKLVIVPHDFLHYVPFHALYDGDEYLLDRHEISYAPSANVYKLCVDKANQARESWIVDRGSKDESRITNHESRRALIMGVADEATPFIAGEVATVKSLWPEAEVFLNEAATLDQLKRSAPGCRLVHLASHGVFRRDNPLFSAIKLSDGWLNVYDIFNLNLPAELVTLSACETGLNEISPGDELFGLMRGFLYAGAPSLVVSLWVVHDRSTAAFMKHFYAGLRQGLSKRAALRRAQLAVKQEYQHPYFWAPFILMGAP